jgi:D-lactate dehydrogenase (cytochrome)
MPFISMSQEKERSSLSPEQLESPQSLYASPGELQTAIEKLRIALPNKNCVDTNPDTLRTYGSSENSYHPTSPHSVVVNIIARFLIIMLTHRQVRPMNTEDVVKVVKIAREYRVPITAYSGATSLEGHFSGVIPHIKQSTILLRWGF